MITYEGLKTERCSVLTQVAQISDAELPTVAKVWKEPTSDFISTGTLGCVLICQNIDTCLLSHGLGSFKD